MELGEGSYVSYFKASLPPPACCVSTTKSHRYPLFWWLFCPHPATFMFVLRLAYAVLQLG